jgi:hypothetical protein
MAHISVYFLLFTFFPFISGPIWSENPLIPLLFHFGQFFVPTANGTKFNGPADGRSNEITVKVTHFSVAIIGVIHSTLFN